LVRIAVAAAAAERAAVVLAEEAPRVRALATADGEVTLQRISLDDSHAVPRSIIERVLRSGKELVVEDARRDERFFSDPYIERVGVRSILAVPLRTKERTVGILYFENNLATNAFSANRVEIFHLLSSGMAIAIENSLLFQERRRAEEALQLLADASG